MSDPKTALIAVPVSSIPGPLSYRVPARLAARVVPGVRARVPLGGRRVVGVVVETRADDDEAATRQLEDVLDDAPLVLETQLALARFVARYYHAPLGDAVRLALPPDTAKDVPRALRITAQGLAARVFVAAHGLTVDDAKVLASFPEDVWRAERAARADGGTPARVRKLVEKGLLEVRDGAAVHGPREDPLVVAVDDGDALPARSPALSAVDAYLRVLGAPARLSALGLVFPGAKGKVARLASLGRVRVDDAVRAGPGAAPVAAAPPRALTYDQSRAVGEILDGAPRAFLLEGVTGSGKTEVYLEVLRATLRAGQGAILVVPEIGLTPQLVERVTRAVNEPIAVLHSALTDAERRDALHAVRRGERRVVVGARSALFAPVPDLGLIVVDEEHDGSLKQDESPRYHGRDVALWRAKHEGARVILGSATPSLESFEGAREGRLVHLRLGTRVGGGGALPLVTVVDLRARHAHHEMRARDRVSDEDRAVVLSAPLVDAMAETLGKGEQVLLFLNRRGFASVWLCTACGHVEECPHCTVALTVHKGRARLVCHQCDFERAVPSSCTACGGPPIPLGVGTEKVEAVVRARFPEARIARLDRDTVKAKGALERTLRAVARREIDVLIGTQMVAKGHDFPGIALVGVVLADVAFTLPDFRAAERAFALLTQVAGRAGRGADRGRVVVQTYRPEHPAVVFAESHDVAGFLAAERAARHAHHYPPFSRLALVRVEGEDATAADAIARRLAQAVRDAGRARLPPGTWDVLGPAPAPIERLRGRTRVQVLVRADSPRHRATLLQPLDDERHAKAAKQAQVRVVIDVDPVSML